MYYNVTCKSMIKCNLGNALKIPDPDMPGTEREASETLHSSFPSRGFAPGRFTKALLHTLPVQDVQIAMVSIEDGV